MQNSKFLKFVSKMSRGELIVEDQEVKGLGSSGRLWADEYHQQLATQKDSQWTEEVCCSVYVNSGLLSAPGPYRLFLLVDVVAEWAQSAISICM